MKLEDLTDEELDEYPKEIQRINALLCDPKSDPLISGPMFSVNLYCIIFEVFKDAGWKIHTSNGYWIFNSALKDNDPKRSAWNGPSLRPVSQ